MSDYSQINDYSAKDALATGNPSKRILGSEIDAELAAISTAITSKYDSTDLASQAQAEAETSNTVLLTPLRLANWADANGGMVGDIQALADPNADSVLFWDDSAGAVAGCIPDGTNVTISGTTLGLGANLSLTAATFSGTLAANLFSGSGASLTSIPAGQLTGSIADARLSANVPLIDAANSFTAANIFTDKDLTVGHTSQLNATASRGNITVNGATDAIVQFGTAGTRRGYVIHGGASGAMQVINTENSTLALGTNSTVELTFNADGTITTPNTSAAEVGYKGLPPNTQSGATYTLVLTDAGKVIDMAIGTGSQTLTIPANASVAFPVGTVIRVWSNATSGVTIDITTDTLYLAGTGFATTGSRTLAYGGVATLEKRSSTSWFISGAGLS